jgi:hypothetical protein
MISHDFRSGVLASREDNPQILRLRGRSMPVTLERMAERDPLLAEPAGPARRALRAQKNKGV